VQEGLNSESIPGNQRPNNNFMKIKIAVGICVVAGALVAHGADIKVDVAKLPPAAAKKDVTFATDIKPIFEKSCAKCHGADVEKPKGKFRSDTLTNVLKGGGEGVVVVGGDLAKSPLIAMVANVTEDEEMYMPPKGNKAKIAPLTKDEIGLVRAWIEQGAK
jgi:mono/diheme cytochrome c family protein